MAKRSANEIAEALIRLVVVGREDLERTLAQVAAKGHQEAQKVERSWGAAFRSIRSYIAGAFGAGQVVSFARELNQAEQQTNALRLRLDEARVNGAIALQTIAREAKYAAQEMAGVFPTRGPVGQFEQQTRTARRERAQAAAAVVNELEGQARASGLEQGGIGGAILGIGSALAGGPSLIERFGGQLESRLQIARNNMAMIEAENGTLDERNMGIVRQADRMDRVRQMDAFYRNTANNAVYGPR